MYTFCVLDNLFTARRLRSNTFRNQWGSFFNICPIEKAKNCFLFELYILLIMDFSLIKISILKSFFNPRVKFFKHSMIKLEFKLYLQINFLRQTKNFLIIQIPATNGKTALCKKRVESKLINKANNKIDNICDRRTPIYFVTQILCLFCDQTF